MKSMNYILAILLIALSIISCVRNSDKKPHSKESYKSSSKDSTTIINNNQVLKVEPKLSLLNDPYILKYIIDTAFNDYSDCTRGVAEPVMKKTVFKNAEFKLLSNKITGYEVTMINDKDILVIENCGCESYVLLITFVLQDNSINVNDFFAQYKLSIDLLKSIVNGIDSPIDLSAAIDKLQEYISLTSDSIPIKLNEDLVYKGEEICESIMVEEYKIIENRSLLRISASIGPL